MSERRGLTRIRRARLRMLFGVVKSVFDEIGPEFSTSTDTVDNREKFKQRAEEFARTRYRMSPILIMLLIKLIPVFIDLFFSGKALNFESRSPVFKNLFFGGDFNKEMFFELEDGICQLLLDANDKDTVTDRSSIHYLEGRFAVGPSDFLRVIAAILTVLAEFYDWWNQ